jgi:hypothetical protein
MNDSKAIVKKKQKINPQHGVYSWLKTGRIRPSIRGHKKLQAYLMDIERELTELQGPGGMTAGREILIKSTVEAFGAVLLAGMYCKQAGLLRPDMARRGVIEFQPVLGKQFLAFMNTIRQNLMALGLDSKKGEEILDLGKYIELKDAQKSQAKARKGRPTAVAGQVEAGGDSDHQSAEIKQIDPGASGEEILGKVSANGTDLPGEGERS